jgi:hypothetical protein
VVCNYQGWAFELFRKRCASVTVNGNSVDASNVLCECPRHVAELISQLASFEQYSQECLNKSTDDAHLHAFLCHISGSARALFENALEKIAHHEGIDLNEAAP